MSKKLFFDLDNTWFLSSRRRIDMGENVDESVVKAYIDQFATTDVSDFVFCVFGTLSAFPSKVKTFFADRLKETCELGEKVDYSNTNCKVADTLWNKKGLDLYAIWLERCKHHSINPWFSFRMNDAHSMFELPSFLVPPEYYENFPTHSRVRHRKQTQYFDRLKDYELLEIRQEMLDYIDEALSKYDIYGIVLDYQREFECFQIGHEVQGRKFMTEFVGEIKNIVSKYEQKYNHKIKIAARALESPIHCEEIGLDIVEWARLGYIDMYIAAPRWWTTNNDMPIRLWKQILQPYGVEVAGTVEYHVSSYPGALRDVNTVESALGAANNILSQGADYVYLFNYFPDTKDLMPGNSDNPERHNTVADQTPEGLHKLLSCAGDIKKISKQKRRNIITFTEKLPLGRIWDNQLPLKIVTAPEGAGEKKVSDFGDKFTMGFLRIPTGYVNDTDKLTLRLGVSDGIKSEDIKVYANSTKCIYTELQECGKPYLYDGKLLCFDVPAEAMKNTYILMAEIIKSAQTVKDFNIEYVDVVINPI